MYIGKKNIEMTQILSFGNEDREAIYFPMLLDFDEVYG